MQRAVPSSGNPGIAEAARRSMRPSDFAGKG
jgi:hypothetical protein